MEIDYKLANQNLLKQVAKIAEECSYNYSLAVQAQVRISKLEKELEELKQSPTQE